MAAPVIEAADCTVSGSNTAAATWAVSHPATSTGDLLIWNIAWDNSTDTTDVAEPAGPNSEVLSELNATPVSSNTGGTAEVRGKAWYTVCTGAWTAGTLTFTPTATESWTATVIRVPAGEFDPADPFGWVGTLGSTNATDTTVDNPVGTIGATDGTGTLVWFAFVDVDPLSATPPTNWTIRQAQDLGAVAHGIATRNAQTVNGETIAGATWGIAGDSWGSISYIVRGPPVYAVTGTIRFVGQTPTIATTDLGENAWAVGAWASGAWATGAWDVAAAGGETASPSVGTIRVTGATPTVTYTDHASVTPSIGTFRYVGQTPTVGFTHSVAPTVGAVVVNGQTPSLFFTDNMAVAPSVGSLLFVGQQPSIGATISVAPSVGSVVFAGQTPTVAYTDHVAVAPSVGTVRFDGAAPSVGFTHSVTPTVATFRFVGLTPTVTWGDNIAVTPSAGTLVFVGQTPTVENYGGYAWHPNAWASGAWAVGAWAPDQPGASVSPSVGTVRFVGQTPTVETGAKVVAPSAGVLRFVGNAPPLGDTSALVDFDTPSQNLQVGADLQTFNVLVRKTTGTNPSVDIDLYENGSWVADLVSGAAVTSEVGQIVSGTWNASLLADISGAGVQCFIYGHSSADAQVEIGAVEWEAAIEAVVSPTAGTFRLVGQIPTVSSSAAITVTPSVGTVRVVGATPTVSVTDAQAVAPTAGVLRFVGQQPSATWGDNRAAQPSAGTYRFVGQVPTVGYTHSVDPIQAVLRLEGAYPSVTVTEHQWASPSVGTVRLDGWQPTAAITANIWVTPVAGALGFDGQQPSLVEGGDKTAAPESGALRFVGNAPFLGELSSSGGGTFVRGPSKRHTKKFRDWLEAINQDPIVVKPVNGKVRVRGNAPFAFVTEVFQPVPVPTEAFRPILTLPKRRQAVKSIDQEIAQELRYAEEIQAQKRKRRRKQDEEILLML